MAGEIGIIGLDRQYVKELVHCESKLISLQGKIAELSRNVDYSHKIAVDRLTNGKITAKEITTLEERLSMLEWIANNMENIFQITVLTSPRD